jgi:hypothetical protein
VRGETAGRTCSPFSVPRHFYEYEIRGQGGLGRGVGRVSPGSSLLRSIIADTPVILALHKAARDAKADAHTRATRKGHLSIAENHRPCAATGLVIILPLIDSETARLLRRLPFSTGKECSMSARVKWLDMHNRTRIIVIAITISRLIARDFPPC